MLSYQNPEASLVRNGIGMTPLQHELEDYEPIQILSTILTSNHMNVKHVDEEGGSYWKDSLTITIPTCEHSWRIMLIFCQVRK